MAFRRLGWSVLVLTLSLVSALQVMGQSQGVKPSESGQGCPDLGICVYPGDGCTPVHDNTAAVKPPTCHTDGIEPAQQACGFKQCGLLVCNCGPKQPRDVLCKAGC